MVIETSGEAALAVNVLGITRDGDEMGAGKRCFGPEEAGEFVAVETRQAEIEEQDFGEKPTGSGDPIRASVGEGDFAAATSQQLARACAASS